MRTTANLDLTLDEMTVLEYAINTAIDHIEFLKTLNVNLPELKPENDLVGRMIAIREKCKGYFL